MAADNRSVFRGAILSGQVDDILPDIISAVRERKDLLDREAAFKFERGQTVWFNTRNPDVNQTYTGLCAIVDHSDLRRGRVHVTIFEDDPAKFPRHRVIKPGHELTLPATWLLTEDEYYSQDR
jgi:hypothetical protein